MVNPLSLSPAGDKRRSKSRDKPADAVKGGDHSHRLRNDTKFQLEEKWDPCFNDSQSALNEGSPSYGKRERDGESRKENNDEEDLCDISGVVQEVGHHNPRIECEQGESDNQVSSVSS